MMSFTKNLKSSVVSNLMLLFLLASCGTDTQPTTLSDNGPAQIFERECEANKDNFTYKQLFTQVGGENCKGFFYKLKDRFTIRDGVYEAKLGGWQLVDVKPISYLTFLTSLDLSNNKISDLRPLNTLTGLKKLDVSDNPLKGIEQIAGLPNLRELKSTGNNEQRLTKIGRLPARLTHLDVTNNAIYQWDGLLDAIYLKVLKADNQVLSPEHQGPSASSIATSLERARRLESVNLRNLKQLTTINFSKMAKIRSLDLSHTSVTNSFFKNLPSKTKESLRVLTLHWPNQRKGLTHEIFHYLTSLREVYSFDSDLFCQASKVHYYIQHIAASPCSESKEIKFAEYYPNIVYLDGKGFKTTNPFRELVWVLRLFMDEDWARVFQPEHTHFSFPNLEDFPLDNKKLYNSLTIQTRRNENIINARANRSRDRKVDIEDLCKSYLKAELYEDYNRIFDLISGLKEGRMTCESFSEKIVSGDLSSNEFAAVEKDNSIRWRALKAKRYP